MHRTSQPVSKTTINDSGEHKKWGETRLAHSANSSIGCIQIIKIISMYLCNVVVVIFYVYYFFSLLDHLWCAEQIHKRVCVNVQARLFLAFTVKWRWIELISSQWAQFYVLFLLLCVCCSAQTKIRLLLNIWHCCEWVACLGLFATLEEGTIIASTIFAWKYFVFQPAIGWLHVYRL